MGAFDLQFVQDIRDGDMNKGLSYLCVFSLQNTKSRKTSYLAYGIIMSCCSCPDDR